MTYNSKLAATLGLSPYKKVFNQKPRKPQIFTANESETIQGRYKPSKDPICY